MKKILSIKWGVIFGIVFGVFSIYAMIKHQIINGFDRTKLCYELLIYGSFVISMSYGIETIRKDIKGGVKWLN